MLNYEAMGIGSKIKRLRDELGMSQTDLAHKVGVKQPTIAQLESGDNKTTKHIFKIAAALGVAPNALDPNIPLTSEFEDPNGLPIMGEVRAGAWLEIDSDVELVGHIPASTDQRYRGQRQYALKVVGTSMNKVARPGVFVVVADWSDNGADLKHDDLVVVRRERAHTYEVTLKKARKVGDAWELWPESDDPKHQEPIRLNDENPEWSVVIVGKVIGKYEPL
jgi:SOS-response transcriptional repressor LexA